MINTENDKYFYSEGYVYKGEETICRMYGTIKQMESIGNSIVEKLNKRIITVCDCAMPDPIDPYSAVDKETCRKCNNLIQN